MITVGNNMITGGCDLGSATSKAVLLKDGKIIASEVIPSGQRPESIATEVLNRALKKAGLSSLDDLDYLVGTGYGRLKVPCAQENVSEITCHMRGAYFLWPKVKTVIDMGGQDCKAIGSVGNGKVRDFVMNDKCAAGTGRFLEAMARVLECGIDGLSELALKAENPSTISSQCSVFAESEVITLLNGGVEVSDIAAGVLKSVARRVSALARRVGLNDDIVITGGCAKSEALVNTLEEKLGKTIWRLGDDPQIAGALGAADIAQERYKKKLAGAEMPVQHLCKGIMR